MRNAWLQDNIPVKVGFMAACPDGNGFNAKFEHFEVKHLPDMRRLEWLKKMRNKDLIGYSYLHDWRNISIFAPL